MYITIAGKLGSGKSTVCELIKEAYGYQIYSTGKIQRDIAEKMGISVLELNELMGTKPEYDALIDNETVRISEASVGQNILFDSRMAWHFVRESFKVFTYVSPYEAARRVMSDERGDVEKYRDIEDAKHQLLKRTMVENERFKEKYQVDNLDYNNYNLIIDTTWETPERIVAELMRGAERYQSNPSMRQLAFSPKSLYPMCPVEALDSEKLVRAEQCLKSGEEPEEILLVQEGALHYIVSGAETVAAALKLGIPFVTARMAQIKDGDVYKVIHLSDAQRHAYETLGNFSYKD